MPEELSSKKRREIHQVREPISQEKDVSFLEHLEDLRWTIIHSFIGILFFAIIAFVFHSFLFDNIILLPKNSSFWTNVKFCEASAWLNVEQLCINSKPFNIINITMSGQFAIHISVSLVAGFIVAFPFVFWRFWQFIKPALYHNEKQQARGAVFFSSLLFLTGILFGYYLIVPLSVHFLGSYNVSSQVTNQINLQSYISTFNSVLLASGVIFELPVLVYFLSKAGLVTPQFLRHYRRHAVILILILSAIITPPDIFSQILVCLPLLVLYEVGIIISRRVTKKK